MIVWLNNKIWRKPKKSSSSNRCRTVKIKIEITAIVWRMIIGKTKIKLWTLSEARSMLRPPHKLKVDFMNITTSQNYCLEHPSLILLWVINTRTQVNREAETRMFRRHPEVKIKKVLLVKVKVLSNLLVTIAGTDKKIAQFFEML